ncbi:hypothetical protein [Thalassospira sp.]|uniref:hypothetical protein n=1 Tax=Thalassospira sp. TaxID=1912094 RepID=UPI0025F40035|nr:hypothetical protein [Thalassospira sp.]|tara:strand:- start:3594 stop:3881 length:288 start_codon:yes stop_codon:yes gene_type:complete
MMYDETGQEDRQPVYLPENRHHWASNDEVDKPVRDLSRGPVRARFKRPSDDTPRISITEWMKENLPGIGATAIAAIVILCVVVAIYTDVAGIVTR